MDILYKFFEKNDISYENLKFLLQTNEFDEKLFKLADLKRKEYYKNYVYLRGLIEITNYCKNDCFYCGIRNSNRFLRRYRLTKSQILNCCETGYKIGLRTFVLQGGEDIFFDDSKLCDIISEIRRKYKDCAITISMGERSFDSYKNIFAAGANRYLLRHETALDIHYKKLHPKNMSLENRKKCLQNLKKIGFQVGAGFLVGSPFQTINCILEDFKFLKELKPDMIGIGPFISCKNTPFENFENGNVKMVFKILAITRIMFPYALIPATTAVLSLAPNSLEKCLKAGTNVLMPNISPKKYMGFYSLYDNKIKRKEKTLKKLKKNMYVLGYKFKLSKGDVNLKK